MSKENFQHSETGVITDVVVDEHGHADLVYEMESGTFFFPTDDPAADEDDSTQVEIAMTLDTCYPGNARLAEYLKGRRVRIVIEEVPDTDATEWKK